MNVASTLLMFMVGMLLVAGLRMASGSHYKDDLDRQLGAGDYALRPARRPGALVAIHTPSLVDMVPAALFTLCTAPLLYV